MKTTVPILIKKGIFLSFVFSLFSSYAQTLSLVSDINVGANGSHPHYLTEFNSKIYFVALNGTGHKLYSSDGTTAGTTLIGPTVNANGVVWYLTKYNNKLYFMYDDGINGLELWTSDGTTAGTTLLKDIYPGNLGSQPEKLTVCNGLLFFQASTPTRSQGLWVTDGTVSGTQMLGNQYSNPFGSTSNFIVLNNKIYFEGNAGSGYGLWESNGTTAGTLLVKSGFTAISGGTHAVLGNDFYFQHGDNTNGIELWKSDGTDAGTVLVKDINTVGFSSTPQYFFTDGLKVYFTADDGINGQELWVTDGTTIGTQLVKDVAVGSANSVPNYASSSMIIFNNESYFFARNGSNIELYKTNGTLAGTTLIKINTNLAYVTYSYQFNGKFYFVGATTIGGSEYLYESDGTTSGTYQISPSVSTYSTNPNGFNMIGFDGNLYLPAFFGSQGNEFCKLTTLLSGLNDFENQTKISIYPNPTKNEIFISSGFEIKSINVVNSIGQTVISKKVNSQSTAINVGNLTKGIYIISVVWNNNKVENHKFIKD